MLIDKLEIKNFRNINDELFKPCKNVNIIFGENSNGKTSLIESIYSVSNLKSFRTSRINEVITENKSKSIINCYYEKNKCFENIKIEINKNNKIYYKNNKKCNLDDYLWSLFTIVFKPEDLIFVSGSPGKRRELIDKAIFFIDKKYLEYLKKYNKIILNKNKNLKENKIKEIDEWNRLIAKYSAYIVNKRNEYIFQINDTLKDNSIKFNYIYNISNTTNLSIDDLETYFYEEINKNLDKEIKYKFSIIGAHRQNIDFYINNKKLSIFGSQGQKRTFILLFRSAQIINFKNNNYYYPILLLDDMASELDENNRNTFFKIIESYGGQVFITTTENNLFLRSHNVKRHLVENGIISSFS